MKSDTLWFLKFSHDGTVNITLITRCLFTEFPRNTSFFLETECQTAFMGVFSCG